MFAVSRIVNGGGRAPSSQTKGGDRWGDRRGVEEGGGILRQLVLTFT